MSTTEPKSREAIEASFATLLSAHRKRASQIETRAEAAERGREREVVDQASAYTVDAIVKGLAELQLEFSKALDGLADRMEGESGKVGQLRRAIEIERRRLAELEDLTVAAEAVALLEQDHARKLADLDAKITSQQEELDARIDKARDAWAEEDKAREEEDAAYKARIEAERKAEEDEHSYARERAAQQTEDQQAERRRDLERELAATTAEKDKDWASREATLDGQAEETAALLTKVEGMDEAIAEAEQKARDKAIASIKRDASHEANLRDREAANASAVFELKIQTLEKRIADQSAHMEDLSQRLNAALAQAQKLATEALRGAHQERG
ncbi:hypothetical protein PPSIR1_00555 [Plesiocystis pacifica SIR-1]|uniref:Myosin heavy chain n=1 Tax=Plesiocystis pacifica SIR-1 TaxID=391625 RepID=A6G7G9_9BACT|nr:hypothetical protein [Plesiocystis pacifica]EDM78178.1 hypothetical protein PPSIR1_00555 [Plesiocystis pacifica SIR-1]